MKIQFPFTSKVPDDFDAQIHRHQTVVDCPKGTKITIQYEIGQYFYFLLEGSIQFSIKIDDEYDELSVGKSNKQFTPVGWSGFREPHRYATTVTCLEDSKFARWEHHRLREIIKNDPESGKQFLLFIVHQSQLMLQDTRKVLSQLGVKNTNSFLKMDPFSEISKSTAQPGIEILKRSPFFEIFTASELEDFAGLGEATVYDRGDKIFNQGEKSKHFDILLEGKVALIYTHENNSSMLDKRIIENEGYIVGSGCFTTEKINHVSCVALSHSTIFHLDLDQLNIYLDKHPTLAVQFYLRMLWFISHRLSSARAKLITYKYDGEIRAVKNLIEQKCTQLSVISDIHKIPHLLSNTYTLSDGIKMLKRLATDGSHLERSIAQASLEVLTEVLKEHEFYNDLSQLYHDVVSAPQGWSHLNVRKMCAQKFLDAFEKTNFIIQGEEHLPNEPAIYIYNHLLNHPFNTLPNNFQLTLDSHFISSVVLFKNFNNPGIRVVRVPTGAEYGHQFYYERLGHIPVYTKDSAAIQETDAEKKKRRSEFYKLASFYLENNTSLLLAPEGQSQSTSQSPAEFKPGAFKLATYMKKEPYIVPIAMANFDKRLNHTTYCCVIKEPFKLSEKVKDPDDRVEMKAFLTNYQKEFRAFVEEAVELASTDEWVQLVNS